MALRGKGGGKNRSERWLIGPQLSRSRVCAAAFAAGVSWSCPLRPRREGTISGANGGRGRRDAGPAARTGRRRFSALERKTLEMLVGLSDRDLTVEVFRITWPIRNQRV